MENREITVRSRVEGIGQKKAKGLVGIENFSGGDWGEKFVGFKKTWIDTYLSDEDSDIVTCFCKLGEGDQI